MLDVRSALRRAMEYNRNRPAIIAGDVELTFEQAWKRGCRLANALHELGLRPGDKVAVLEDNCLEASDFFVAAAVANVVRVPLYRRNSAIAHSHMISHTDCRAVIVSQEYAHEVEQFKDEIEGLKHVIVRGDDYESWLASHSDEDPDLPIDMDDPASDPAFRRHDRPVEGHAVFPPPVDENVPGLVVLFSVDRSG